MWQQHPNYARYEERPSGEDWVAIEEVLGWTFLAGPRMMTSILYLRSVKQY